MRSTKFCVCCYLLLVTGLTQAQEGGAPAPIVYFDMAGENVGALNEFYRKLFNWNPGERGSFSTTAASPLLGGIRQHDFSETLVYIGVKDITAKLAEITTAGGTVEYPRFEVPGVVVLGMFKDPADNRVGLVELNEDGSVKVP